MRAYYIKYRNKFTSILRARKINFYKLNFSGTITIPKLNWNLINNLTGNKNNINNGTLKNNIENNGQIINPQKHPLNRANISNLCFIGVEKCVAVKFKNSLHKYFYDKQLNFSFGQHFLKIINNFKDKTAAGFDKISVKLLKNIASLFLIL